MKLLLLLLVSILCGYESKSQTDPSQELHFNFLGVKDGLPEGTVTSLIQDKAGYIWIGTQNGLIRFDGYNAKKYDFEIKDINSFNISAIYEDNNNNLWIGTANGLYKYNRQQDRVLRYHLDFEGKIINYAIGFIQENKVGNFWLVLFDNIKKIQYQVLLDITTGKVVVYSSLEKGNRNVNVETTFASPWLLDNRDRLWTGSDNGLYEYLPDRKSFRVHKLPGDTAYANIATNMYQDPVHPDWLWFKIRDKASHGTKGIGRFDITNNTLKEFHHSAIDSLSIGSDTATLVLSDSKKRLWFATRKGLSLYNRSTESFTNFNLGAKNGLNGELWSASEDKLGNLWCTGKNGLAYFNTGTGRFSTYARNEKQQDGILNNLLTNLLLDNQDRPWFGTEQLGLQWLDKERSKFKFYRNDAGQVQDFPGGEVNCFAIAPDKSVWISAQHGLFHWWPHLDSFALVHFDKNVPKDVLVTAVSLDEHGQLWFGANSGNDNIRGLYCFNPVNKTTINYRYNKEDSLSLSSNNIHRIIQDSSGHLWIGTFGGGICRFNMSTKQFTRYPYIENNNISIPDHNALDDDEIESMYLDKQNIFWIGTNNGSLNKFDPRSGIFTSYMGKMTMCVTSIEEDDEGNLWAGTYFSGLYMVNKRTNVVQKISEKDGLLYDGCWGMKKDGYNNLWITSSRGLSILNLQNRSIRNITSRNGLPEETSSAALYKDNNGNLLFGTKSGFVELNPDNFKADTSVPIVHIETVSFTKPQLGKQLIDSLLIAYGKHDIRLKYNENRITFNYVGLYYQNPALVQYAYKLSGYDNDWVQAGTRRATTYTNLSPGSYTFFIKAANADGNWISKYDAITIIILPPWWRTWWAYLIYLLTFAALLVGYNAFRSRSLRIQNHLLEEKVTERTHQLSEANEELKASQENIAAQRDELAGTIEELKVTQKQLIQAEKMASLGELTAGIAHEIQNPLNFVNNFSEVNTELLDEMTQELTRGNMEEALSVATDIKDNNEKITTHGKRADAIVKNMLQHSRKNVGQMELVNLNELIDEYLRLSYHGLRAKDKSFNADFNTDFDRHIERITINSQGFSRVLLNLFNNAFYAVNEKKNAGIGGYKPLVSVKTKKHENKIIITITDNGNGIPQNIIDKIFQPFFTTKPTGAGTGLGLSISYDIITKEHNGTLTVVSRAGEFTEFIISLPS